MEYLARQHRSAVCVNNHPASTLDDIIGPLHVQCLLTPRPGDNDGILLISDEPALVKVFRHLLMDNWLFTIPSLNSSDVSAFFNRLVLVVSSAFNLLHQSERRSLRPPVERSLFKLSPSTLSWHLPSRLSFSLASLYACFMPQCLQNSCEFLASK